ncbi:Calmodulin-interacting protein 111 [Platanthera guangdongensis]|uniref:Calmodulin-interacting protein 111 n=1 Tax=Platanthera guangdongensis TaxID=2320717 RepID=A0ABR2M2P7_9ASPA
MPSRVSRSSVDCSAASRLPATPLRELDSGGTDELFNRRLLSNAASRFPHLMSESPLCRVISDMGDSSPNDNYARIWLSEGSSLRPGSLVSVALAASKIQHFGILPLYNYVEYNNGFDADDSFLDEVGCYFAIASVLFCTKVQKNGVRLSKSFSCTMGSPAIGQSLFISPVGDFSSCNNESRGNNARIFHLHKCKNLKLKILPITSRGSLPINVRPIEVDSILSGHGKAKTPSFHFKLPSTVTSPLHMKNSYCSSPCLDASGLNFLLNDEGSKLLYERFFSLWLQERFLLKGNLINVPVCGTNLLASVEGVDELTTSFSSQDSSIEGKNNVLLIEAKTKISLSISTCTDHESSSERASHVVNTIGCISGKEPNDISRLGGLSKEISTLKQIIKSLEFKDPSLRTTGVLLHGPPGTGKTTLALCCARDAGASLFLVNGPEIVSQDYGESERALNNIFDSARKAAPAVVFIDELDVIALAKKAGGEELSHRMVETLLKLMIDIKSSRNILVIAATNCPDSIDPALRQPHIFDQEIEIGVPSPAQRLEILHAILNQMDHSLSSTYMESLAFDAHGFVGADLATLCKEGALSTFHRYVRFESSERLSKGSPSKNSSGDNVDLKSLSSLLSELTMSPSSVSPKTIACFPESNSKYHSYDSCGANQKVLLKVTAEDFEVAKKKVRPSAMCEVMLKLPKIRWEDVGGQREVKKKLIEAVQSLQSNSDRFKRLGIQPPKGLLMIGPPGCSKTTMARVVASEAKMNFFAVKGPELFSKWVGDSEKAVRSIFAKAKANSPAIIFFDEIDGLAVTRGAENAGTSVGDRVVCQLLVEMDGIDERGNVLIIAATNRPDRIDPAFLRPGRFDMILNVLPPNESDREDIFQIYTRNVTCCSDVSVGELARLTEGYTGADIKLVCHMATIAALEESLEINEVSMEHFRTGICRVHPSDISFFQKLVEKFWRRVPGGSV